MRVLALVAPRRPPAVGQRAAPLGGEVQRLPIPGGGELFTAPGRVAARRAHDRVRRRRRRDRRLRAARRPAVRAWAERATPGTSPVMAGGLLYVYDPSRRRDLRLPARLAAADRQAGRLTRALEQPDRRRRARDRARGQRQRPQARAGTLEHLLGRLSEVDTRRQAPRGASLSDDGAESLAGQLLLASPTLQDPNFARTVVLIGVHSEEGAMGVVLNRPSAVTVGEAVPQLEEMVDERGAGVRRRPGAAELDRVAGRVPRPRPGGAAGARADRLPGAGRRPRASSPRRPRAARVFAGYAGWGEGQLDAEIEQGDWIAHAALPEDVFSERPRSCGAGADPQGRQLRAARADAARPERQLSARATPSAARAPRDAHGAYYPSLRAPSIRRQPLLSPPRPSGVRRAQARPLVDDPPQVRRARLGRAAARRQRARAVGRHELLQQLHAAQLRRPARRRPARSAASPRRPATATRSSSRSAPAPSSTRRCARG